jgi:hypothetical protein
VPLKDQDRNDIVKYRLVVTHTKHDGSQLWSGPVVHEDAGDYLTNEYFYRAMTLEEFDSYRTQFVFRQGGGHQGWAPYRAYSVAYLGPAKPATRNHAEQPAMTRLVEVHLPGFVAEMKKEGWVTGKVESGCLSWGIGTAQSNGWQGGQGVRPATKATAKDPWDIFHDILAKTQNSVKLVNVLAVP